MRKSTIGSVAAAICALVLASCVSTSNKSAYTEPTAICDIAGLESKVDSFRDQSRSIRGALAVGTPHGGGAIGAGRAIVDVDRQYSVNNQLNNFDAEVEGQFRTVTSACKAHAKCMEKNRYNERRCGMSFARWTEAEDEFASLAAELRRIDVEITRITVGAAASNSTTVVVNANATAKCESGCCDDHCPEPTHPEPEGPCCDAVNGIFTDCCVAND
ncbi:MAG: hypothetical protein ACFB00_04660 [Parvularculaceae bacterium]